MNRGPWTVGFGSRSTVGRTGYKEESSGPNPPVAEINVKMEAPIAPAYAKAVQINMRVGEW
jgi:hypothetical protein